MDASLKPFRGCGIPDIAHTCLAKQHWNRMWLIDSPSKPHSWHLVSIFIPFSTSSSATGNALLKHFQMKTLILGGDTTFHACSFSEQSEGWAISSTLHSEVFVEVANQYADLTVKHPLQLYFQTQKSSRSTAGLLAVISLTSPGTKSSLSTDRFQLRECLSIRSLTIRLRSKVMFLT